LLGILALAGLLPYSTQPSIAEPVTASTGLEARPPASKIVRSSLRAAGSTVVLVALYYLLPLDTSVTWFAITMLVIGLGALVALVIFQVWRIIRSPFPGLRAIAALATSIPLFLLLFAAVYVVLDTDSAGNFSQHLTRTDALYFTVTVFSTVGFGDITATTETARLVVTVQMIADLIVIGVGIKVIVGAVTRGRQQRPADASPDSPTGSAARAGISSAAGDAARQGEHEPGT